MNAAAFAIKALIRAYQWFISPLLDVQCRHWPSCSVYAADAVETHGAMKGLWLALMRFARCNPFGSWGYDPVPPRKHTHGR
jgi:putative membrane protein insertion efficiency factor